MASDNYFKFVAWLKEKKPEVKPFTRTQYEFIEFLLENREQVGKIGNIEEPFLLIRNFFRSVK